MHSELQPDEPDLVGRWLLVGGRVEADAVSNRIDWLLRARLEQLRVASGGWEVQYRDPADGRLWELTYPQGELQGGGPRRLRVLAPEAARAKYGADAG